MGIIYKLSENILVAGSGEKTLVFLHYFGGSAETWKWVMTLLSEYYTCISIHLPGFGGTEIMHEPSVEYYADYVQRELEQLAIPKYIVIGHSMSGKIAYKMALQDIDLAIQHLILLAPSPPTIERMPDAEKRRMLQHPDEKVEIETVGKIIGKPLTKEQFSLAVHTQHIIDGTVWKWWIQEGMNVPIAPNNKQEVKIPVTVITSEDDPCITTQIIQEDVMPNLPSHAQLIWCKDTGHLYPIEDPQWLADTLQTLLGKEH